MRSIPSAARSQLAAGLLGLYPAAWRTRYEDEVRALIEDDPPGIAGLLSLLSGAADAHLHPGRVWRAALPRAERARLSICALFVCWIVLSLMGMGFQKETEDAGFLAASSHHPLLTFAQDAILAGAVLGAAAIAFGGLPLVAHSLRHGLLTRDRRLLALIAMPVLSVLAFLVLTRLLVAVAPSRGGGFPAGFVVEIMLPWQAGALLCAGICAFAPRIVLSRTPAPPHALRRAAQAGVALTLAIALVSGGLVTYATALWLQEPALSAGTSGPVGASTGAMLTAEALAAVLAGGLALRCAARARRATANV